MNKNDLFIYQALTLTKIESLCDEVIMDMKVIVCLRTTWTLNTISALF